MKSELGQSRVTTRATCDGGALVTAVDCRLALVSDSRRRPTYTTRSCCSHPSAALEPMSRLSMTRCTRVRPSSHTFVTWFTSILHSSLTVSPLTAVTLQNSYSNVRYTLAYRFHSRPRPANICFTKSCHCQRRD